MTDPAFVQHQDSGDAQPAAPRPPPPPVRSGYELLRLERDALAREFDRVLAMLEAKSAECDRLRAGIADAREPLAAYAHDAWAGWMAYLYGKTESQPDGSRIIPKWAVTRWLRQMTTAYADLPEAEKASDRAEADKMLACIEAPL